MSSSSLSASSSISSLSFLAAARSLSSAPHPHQHAQLVEGWDDARDAAPTYSPMLHGRPPREEGELIVSVLRSW
jgi:hypothetical protein